MKISDTDKLDALHAKTNFKFARFFAELLNDESGEALHPIAVELLGANIAPRRAIAIATAADGLTPATIEKTDLVKFFDTVSARLTGITL